MEKGPFWMLGGEEGVLIDYTIPLSQALADADVVLSEWDTDNDPSAMRDEKKAHAQLSVEYLLPLHFTSSNTAFDLLKELRKFGRPVTLREVLGVKACSEVLRNLLRIEAPVRIDAIPVMGTLQEDGKEVPSIARHQPSGRWGLIPLVAWLPTILLPSNLLIVVTKEERVG